jgi:hypothetical protein
MPIECRSLVPGGFFSPAPFDRTVPVSIRCNDPGAINGAVCGYQDPPADGGCGPPSTWARSKFARRADIAFKDQTCNELKSALPQARPLPLAPRVHLAGNIVRATPAADLQRDGSSLRDAPSLTAAIEALFVPAAYIPGEGPSR